MADLNEQVARSVLKYNANADKIDLFLNGTEEETISSEVGEQPTLAKMLKNIENATNSKINKIDPIINQISLDKTEIGELKTQIDNKLELLKNNAGRYEVLWEGDISQQYVPNVAMLHDFREFDFLIVMIHSNHIEGSRHNAFINVRDFPFKDSGVTHVIELEVYYDGSNTFRTIEIYFRENELGIPTATFNIGGSNKYHVTRIVGFKGGYHE